MRTWTMAALLGLAACTGLGSKHANSDASTSATSGLFAGEWAWCVGTTAPEECSRYVLLQRGARICGTWFHFASGKAYMGRVIAHADSSTEARRTHVCGRRSAETDTECEDGWQRIDKPLRLCDGKLTDLTRADGICATGYNPVPMTDAARDDLQAQPWLQDCLSREP